MSETGPRIRDPAYPPDWVRQAMAAGLRSQLNGPTTRSEASYPPDGEPPLARVLPRQSQTFTQSLQLERGLQASSIRRAWRGGVMARADQQGADVDGPRPVHL